MEGGPLLSKWWVEESKKFVPYLNVSAQLDDKPDQKLMREYGLRGYPSFVFLDDSGVLLYGKEPYWRPDSPTSLNAGLSEVGDLFQLRKLVQENPDDEVARARLTLIEGMLDPIHANIQAMDVASRVKGVPEQLVEKWTMARRETRFLIFFEPYRAAFRNKQPDREAKRLAAIEGCYKMWVEGEKIAQETEYFRPFLVLSFDGALAASDAKVAQQCLAIYEDNYGVHDRFLKGMKSRLEKVTGSAEGGEVGSVGDRR